jgi:hypothetical protein
MTIVVRINVIPSRRLPVLWSVVREQDGLVEHFGDFDQEHAEAIHDLRRAGIVLEPTWTREETIAASIHDT